MNGDYLWEMSLGSVRTDFYFIPFCIVQILKNEQVLFCS